MLVVGICKNDPELRQRLASVNAPIVTWVPEAIDLDTFGHRAGPKLWALPVYSFPLDPDRIDNYEDDEVADDEQGESETQTESSED
ncbi:hypothetical protein C8R45DRAFT_1219131 [Mycena sanguinolenta]|nr:hypothetical protein C8R45DRAFT_1219131 [Mycena sanguinolenta]